MKTVLEEMSRCSGCGVCEQICPTKAISMDPDSMGFLYPCIDRNICIDCGACRRRCPTQTPALHDSIAGYAAAAMSAEVLEKSASGGAFSALAEAFVNRGGAVCGAALETQGEKAAVRHVMVTDPRDLDRLAGSKYVQSHAAAAYSQIEEKLSQGIQVLFCGTPCQVAGVKTLFGKKYGDLLYTADLVCHGVSGPKVFSQWISWLEEKNGFALEGLRFRDKRYGWGLNGWAWGTDARGEKTGIHISPEREAYYGLFLRGESYRASCYQCPFACPQRAGDITLGDFWGIENVHPQMLKENGGDLDSRAGVSCLLVNTPAGEQLLENWGSALQRLPSTPEMIGRNNTQLNRPSQHTPFRDQVATLWEKGGYAALYRRWTRRRRKEITLRRIRKLTGKLLPK